MPTFVDFPSSHPNTTLALPTPWDPCGLGAQQPLLLGPMPYPMPLCRHTIQILAAYLTPTLVYSSMEVLICPASLILYWTIKRLTSQQSEADYPKRRGYYASALGLARLDRADRTCGWTCGFCLPTRTRPASPWTEDFCRTQAFPNSLSWTTTNPLLLVLFLCGLGLTIYL